jgi:gliding motility-associated-like protein
MIRTAIYILLFVFLSQFGLAQLSVSAGSNKVACINGSVILGGAPSVSGGSPPYTYSWTPSTFLNSTIASNPTASGVSSYISYTLQVRDKDGNTGSASAFVIVDQIYIFSAGIDTGFCFGQQPGIKIGASNNDNSFHTFSWSPTTGLDNPSATNPIATPTIPTTYTLTVSDGICPNNVSQVTVTPFLPPPVDAGWDTIIDEGNTITLLGSGGVIYWWQPDYNLKYGSTPSPDVWPITTTTYTLFVEDQHKCYANDTVRVNVKNGDLLFFYSAFTPNGDGDNDQFYIGNLEKYPDNNLKIYNRYGKLIFSATNYANDWNGTYLGNQIPTGTYFYIFDDGKGKEYKGTVTILR